MVPKKRLLEDRLRNVVMTMVAASSVALTLVAAPVSGASRSTVIHAVGAENEYANVISQIGGRYVEVQAVMSNPNTDPHTFEASTSVAQEIASAKLIVQNGVGYDAFMNQLESASPSSSRKVLSVQSLLGLSNNTKNPHLWYKPTTMPLVARAIEKDLSSLDPIHALYFEARLTSLLTSLKKLDADILSFRSSRAGVKVATTEPVADYLLQALGLDNETPFPFQADVMNGVDPSPEDISFQQHLFTSHLVKVFCYNAQVSSPVTLSLRDLAMTSHVPVVAVYETMPTPHFDYQTWMIAEINAIGEAIEHHTSTTSL
jgi:zinc/manganese transport system substrate-binding protein